VAVTSLWADERVHDPLPVPQPTRSGGAAGVTAHLRSLEICRQSSSFWSEREKRTVTAATCRTDRFCNCQSDFAQRCRSLLDWSSTNHGRSSVPGSARPSELCYSCRLMAFMRRLSG
jgi:hypothetical protein